MLKIIKKADIILFIAIVITGLSITYYAASGGTSGEEVVIKVRGVEQGRYSLKEDRTIKLNKHGYINVVQIKNGKVKMQSANCGNQNCVHQGEITKTTQSIVCLPNRVTVEIVGGGDGVDSIAE